MSEHDQIEVITGNEVHSSITQPSKQAIDGLNTLTDRLNDPSISDLMPGGLTGDQLVSDSLRCRLQELGGAIMDMIEDGFGITDILNGFEMPSLSELGEKLQQLNPMNLLEKLGDISIEGITTKVGELIEGAMDMIGNIVSRTFEQVERVIRGIGDMFDEFGESIKNVGEYVSDVVTGIIGGVGEVLQDITKPIEDIIDTLLKPCDKKTQSAGAAEQQKLLENQQLFDTDMEIMIGNQVGVNNTAQTTGKFSQIIKDTTHKVLNNANQSELSFDADEKDTAGTTDATKASKTENEERREAEARTVDGAGDAMKKDFTSLAVREKTSEDVEQTKIVYAKETTQGELNGGVFSEDECEEILKRFSDRVGKVMMHLTKSLKDLKTSEGFTTTRIPDDLHKYSHVVKEAVVVYYTNSHISIAFMSDPATTADKFNNEMNEQEKIDKWENIVSDINTLPPKNIDSLAKIVELTADQEVIRQVRECDSLQAADDKDYESQWISDLIQFEEINKYVQSGEKDQIINPGIETSNVERITTGTPVYSLIEGGSGNVVEFNRSTTMVNTINE